MLRYRLLLGALFIAAFAGLCWLDEIHAGGALADAVLNRPQPQPRVARQLVLVAAVLDAEPTASTLDELVRALMMLLTTWNKNFYRFFERHKGGMTFEEHFAELEAAIAARSSS